MNVKTPDDWNARYRSLASEPDTPAPEPARVVAEHLHLLPRQGTALDLACGLGGNALALARAGLKTYAWDYSREAIERLAQTARRTGVRLHTEVRDAIARPPEPQSFDAIAVSRFLERDLAAPLVTALRPGGVLFYQTFIRDRVDDSGPRSEAFRLADNELLRLFSDLRILAYREEGTVGDTGRGFRNEAMLVACRP
jgi:tellurite methyltransferase